MNKKDKTIRACKCQCHCEFCSNTVSCDFGHDENTTCEHCKPKPKKEKKGWKKESYQCQKCGAFIGWIGRFLQWLKIPIHICNK